jgi:hypothetical protein
MNSIGIFSVIRIESKTVQILLEWTEVNKKDPI